MLVMVRRLLIWLDDVAFDQLVRAAAAAGSSVGDCARATLRRAVRESEHARMRQAYLVKPDSEAEADDWSTAGEYES